MSRTTGIARSTIGCGLADLRSVVGICSDRVRRKGGGQTPAIETQSGIIAGRKLVGRLLKRLDFSLQANSKTREGASHPDRNAQFEHIDAEAKAFQAAGQPVISVDTKKKELVGDFKNGG